MVDAGAVLKFPGGNPSPKASVHEAPPLPPMDSYDYEQTVELYKIAIAIKRKAEDLALFVDDDRATARLAGIEIIAVQVNSILEGSKFQRVVDSLEDAVYRRIPITLSRAGVDKIHRLEKLVAEADRVIVSAMGDRKVESILGQAASVNPYAMIRGDAGGVSKWMPVIVIGVAGILGIIAVLALTRNSRRSYADVELR